MLNPEDRLKVLKTLFNAGSSLAEFQEGDDVVDRTQFCEEQLEYVEVLVRTGIVRKADSSSGSPGYAMRSVPAAFFCELLSDGSVVRTTSNMAMVDILAEHKVICRETPLHLEWKPIQTQP